MKKKTFKPSYVVDLDEIETLADIPVVFALAKHNAHLALTDEELQDIIDAATPKITFIYCKCECAKKKPWYKRFWNWLIRKNKK